MFKLMSLKRIVSYEINTFIRCCKKRSSINGRTNQWPLRAASKKKKKTLRIRRLPRVVDIVRRDSIAYKRIRTGVRSGWHWIQSETTEFGEKIFLKNGKSRPSNAFPAVLNRYVYLFVSLKWRLGKYPLRRRNDV